MKIDLAPAYEEVIRKILNEHIPDAEIWAFGSRVRWTSKDTSDLDLVIVSDKKTPSNVMALLKLDFEDSELPFRVDVLDWQGISEEFQGGIKEEYVVFQGKKINYQSDMWGFETTIKDQVLLQRGFDITKAEQIAGAFPVVSSGGISSFHNEYKVRGPGVVLGRKGVVGSVYYINENFWPHDTSLWVKDFKGNDPRFVFYFFKNMTEMIKSLDVGSANLTLNRNHVHPIVVIWPRIKQQKKLAKILGNLDEKIQLNYRINKILEEIAQTIFKSWFVDFDPVYAKKKALEKGFSKEQAERAAMAIISGICSPSDFAESLKEMDQRLTQKLSKMSREDQEELARTASLFPSEFQDSELEEIPRGWSYSAISEISNLNTTSIKPSSKPNDEFYHYSIPAYDNGHIPAIEIGSDIKNSKYLVQEYSVLVSKLNPRIKRVWYHNLKKERCSICSTEFMQFIPIKKESRSFLWGLIVNEPFQEEIFKTITGTTGSRQRAQPKQVAKAKIILPTTELQKQYSKAITTLLKKININLEENKALGNIRDTLLPKLLAGEIDLSNIKIDKNERSA